MAQKQKAAGCELYGPKVYHPGRSKQRWGAADPDWIVDGFLYHFHLSRETIAYAITSTTKTISKRCQNLGLLFVC